MKPLPDELEVIILFPLVWTRKGLALGLPVLTKRLEGRYLKMILLFSEERRVRKVGVFCSVLMLAFGLYLLVPHCSDAFDVNSTVTNDGDISVAMEIDAAGTSDGGGGRQNRYEFDLRGRDGTASVTNTYAPETGDTGAGIGFSANPDAGLLDGRLSSEEKIGVNSSGSEACCFGAAGSAYEVEELTSETSGNFNTGSYSVTASGRTSSMGGLFAVGVADRVVTSDPSVFEDNVYNLRGDGVFSISGEYGFTVCDQGGSGTSSPLSGVNNPFHGGGGINLGDIHGLCFDAQ